MDRIGLTPHGPPTSVALAGDHRQVGRRDQSPCPVQGRRSRLPAGPGGGYDRTAAVASKGYAFVDHIEAGRSWDGNADAWTELARAGYDIYRDHLNTPAFLDMLPEVSCLSGLDIGCGEGHNTRLLAGRGARMAAVDISPEVGGYFDGRDGEVSEWLFSAAPPEAKADLPRFRTPRFRRTLGQRLNLLVDAGFILERVGEPRPTDEAIRRWPGVHDAGVVAYFLHVRVKRP